MGELFIGLACMPVSEHCARVLMINCTIPAASTVTIHRPNFAWCILLLLAVMPARAVLAT